MVEVNKSERADLQKEVKRLFIEFVFISRILKVQFTQGGGKSAS